MILKYTQTLLICLLLSFVGLAQNMPGCGSTQPSEANIAFLENLHRQGYYESRIVNETIFIPMKIHIIRNSQGITGFQLSDALRNMCELNDWFKPYGLQFYQFGNVNYIDNST